MGMFVMCPQCKCTIVVNHFLEMGHCNKCGLEWTIQNEDILYKDNKIIREKVFLT
jgi:uncharacterized protein (DUF983 family)